MKAYKDGKAGGEAVDADGADSDAGDEAGSDQE